MNSVQKKNVPTDALKRDRDRYVAFAFASSDMLMELNRAHEVVYLDGATRGFLGDEAEYFIGKAFEDFLAPNEAEAWQNIQDDIGAYGRAQQRRLQLTTRPFPILPVSVSAVILPGNEDSIFLSLSILHHELASEDIGGRDWQTGLLNPNEYARRAGERLKELVESGVDAKMSMLDLPDFKGYIKELEPEKARELSREISDYLREQSVDNDTASVLDDGIYSFVHDDTVASDEVIKEVRSLLTRLDPGIQDFKARLETLDADIGHLNGEDSAQAILYTLNRFSERDENFNFDSLQNSYDSMLQETVERITNFKNTVEGDKFDLAFQPIVDLKNGTVHHYEALVRLHGNNDGRFDNPFHFVNFGEQTGLINDFDLAMCRRTLEVLDRSHADNRWPQIAINLSGKSLSSRLFMDAMLGLLDQYPHIRKQIILEVTESAKIVDMTEANNFIQELRRKGHICCLDDFGVAESSFDYLRYLHVDYVKIDGSYVRENLNTTRGRHLLRAMVGMCRNLGMTIIAEMVEDEQIASILWESGVHYGQGWLFGKPTTDEETLKNWNLTTENFKGIMPNSLS